MKRQPPTVLRRAEQFISDDRRVITRQFVPGDETRIRNVLDRVMGFTEQQVESQLAEVVRDFGARHRRIETVLDDHYQAVEQHLEGREVSAARRKLIGAFFTQEYSIESAALFNPSIVPHPDQSGVPEGHVRFIMSLRATGEGHISSIVFRTGLIYPSGRMVVDTVSPYVAMAKPDPKARLPKKEFFHKLIEMGAYSDTAGRILDALPDEFDVVGLDATINDVRERPGLGDGYEETAQQMLWLARSSYHLDFPSECPTSEIVIFPVTENDSRGIEDARFVRFVDDDGKEIYYGTYTAYNGFRILPELLETHDFRKFTFVPLNGKYVQNKGMALFPRKVNGEYAMIGRLDGENLFMMTSSNVRFWNTAKLLRGPKFPWEMIQIGNCGSPIETSEGWLLLTHGVGAMRRYAIGAALLDLDDPSRVIAYSPEPLLSPNEREREGYVPNVVYSCGAMIHNDQLVIPYAMADSATSVATVAVDDLLDYLLDR